MFTGNSQICIYGEELVYGTAVTPNKHFGIVTGGSVEELNELHTIYPPGANLPIKIDYMTSGYNGRIMSTFNPAVLVDWAMSLKSYTIDAGVSVSGSVLPRRFIGAMCNSCNLDITTDDFPVISYDFIARQCLDGIIPNILAPSPLFINTLTELQVNGNVVDDISNISISIDNGLSPVYTTDRDKPDMRSFSKIVSRNRSFSASIELNSYAYNPMRGVKPEAYIQIDIYLTDVCNNISSKISLIDCKQKKVAEELQPVKITKFTVEYDYRGITYTLL